MRSSDGHHWIALDHIRALAALLVFTWHFAHAGGGHAIPYAGAPAIFPFALMDEGHTGVALFMTLSGYLFAKLLDGKEVDFIPFFWNRFLRLFPLLAVVIVAFGVQAYIRTPGFNVSEYAASIGQGVLYPTLPNGGWSLTVETHFYLILPLLILFTRRLWLAPIVLLGIAVAVRAVLFLHLHEIQSLSYWTILGRVDQFLLGIFAFEHRRTISGKHILAAAVAISFMAYYYFFDLAGGFTSLGGSAIWVIHPTIEGAAYAMLIAYYDSTFRPSNSGISRAIGKMGAYSYSIYLMHPFIVFTLTWVIGRWVPLTNYYVAFLAAAICYCCMYPVGWLSFHLIEKPFLRFRVPYVRRISDQHELWLQDPPVIRL